MIIIEHTDSADVFESYASEYPYHLLEEEISLSGERIFMFKTAKEAIEFQNFLID